MTIVINLEISSRYKNYLRDSRCNVVMMGNVLQLDVADVSADLPDLELISLDLQFRAEPEHHGAGLFSLQLHDNQKSSFYKTLIDLLLSRRRPAQQFSRDSK